MSRLIVRRSATAVGIYSSVVFGFVGTIVASHELPSLRVFGDFSTIVFATGFFQSLFDLTVEEALVKFGFRYLAREDWGRLRGLFRSAFWFKITGSAIGGLALLAVALLGPDRLRTPLLVAALIPLGQSLEGLAGSTLYLRGRYDIRSGFLAWSMLLRLAGIAIGAHFGLLEAIVGMLVAQLAATASVGFAGFLAFRRFPRSVRSPLGDDRRDIVSFIAQSSAGTGVTSLRAGLAPLLLGAVTNTTQVGLFRVAQAPQSGFQALSAPARMVLLTEQTRDWEGGRREAVLRGVRRYSAIASALMVIAVPPLLYFMPDIVKLVYGAKYAGASDAARVFLGVAAVQFVVGWTKSLPVAIGRPGLRVSTHGVESLVIVPLVLVFGHAYGATGAAFAVLAGMLVFAGMWAVIFMRTTADDVAHPPLPLPEAAAQEQGEAEMLAH
jgi:O-antigen/teichoic acid export membrane protein